MANCLRSMAVIAGCLAVPAQASYLDAVEAYGAGDLAAARSQFEVMARLGHRTSQYNLATMLLRGQGGPAQPTEAFGWMTVAAAAGDDSARKILAQMSPLATAADQDRASELLSAFGAEASERRLARLTAGLEPLRSPWAKPPTIEYPSRAKRTLTEGWVVVEVLVGPDGEVRDPRAVFGVNAAMLESAAIAGVQTGLRQVADGQGRSTRYGITSVAYRFDQGSLYILDRDRAEPVCARNDRTDSASRPECDAVRVAEKFLPNVPAEFAHWAKGYTVTSGGASQLSGVTYSIDADRLAALCEQGHRGDPPSQVLCGSLLMFEGRVLQADRDLGYRMLMRAALAGQPDAALLAGIALMSTGDEAARAEGLKWWEVAAQNGSNAARARLLDVWLHEKPVARGGMRRAGQWLPAIAAADDDWAIKHAAALWAAHPDEQLRDPWKALSLLPKLRLRAAVDPQVHEIEAAARAAMGNATAAAAAQDMAIAAARVMGWDVAEMEGRKARYQMGGVWLGNLILGIEVDPGPR